MFEFSVTLTSENKPVSPMFIRQVIRRLKILIGRSPKRIQSIKGQKLIMRF
jgi:hypothetical protein